MFLLLSLGVNNAFYCFLLLLFFSEPHVKPHAKSPFG